MKLLSKLAGGLLLLSTAIGAQANTNPNINVELAFISNFSFRGRVGGAFPNGTNGFSMSTTICNQGSQIVEWMAAMNPNHPFITFMVCRSANGRFEQISDWSYVKHGWFALASSQCTPCTAPPGGAGPYLGLGCSDTYSTGNNGDRFDLGPPAEIDPWLGEWDPNCSLFDTGLFSSNCDGFRSLTNSQVNTLNSTENRIRITDADLDVPGASFFYQGYYVVESEGDAVRENNMAHRRINFNWTGSSWNPNPTGSVQNGTILDRWSGASVSSAKNADDDGRVYVGVQVTGPSFGKYHYEYAFHNRDNFGGIGSVTIPLCPGARITDFGFSDVDQDASNQWTMTRNANDVTFSTTDNPMRWNTVTNIWFDCDAAPQTGADLTLGQFTTIAGASSFDVTTTLPGKVSSVYLGPGCSNGEGLNLFTNLEATLGNSNFKLLCDGGEANTVQFLFQSVVAGTTPFQGCDLYFGAVPVLVSTATVQNNLNLRAIYDLPVPNDVSLEGLGVNVQAAGTRSTGGPIAGAWEVSNGLRVRVGSNLSDCE